MDIKVRKLRSCNNFNDCILRPVNRNTKQKQQIKIITDSLTEMHSKSKF